MGMWEELGGKGKIPQNRKGTVNTTQKMLPGELEEESKKRKTYLRYNRGEGKVQEKEIPGWDRQDFKE
jgi:hypothetical protein